MTFTVPRTPAPEYGYAKKIVRGTPFSKTVQLLILSSRGLARGPGEEYRKRRTQVNHIISAKRDLTRMRGKPHGHGPRSVGQISQRAGQADVAGFDYSADKRVLSFDCFGMFTVHVHFLAHRRHVHDPRDSCFTVTINGNNYYITLSAYMNKDGQC